MDNQGEIILYQPNEAVRLDVKLENETVWLTQAQMVELFQTSKQNISLHINNIFKEKELEQLTVVKESLTTAGDRKNYRTKYYNLDVIISVGYRVKSQRGTQFRIWATSILKDYLLKGYSINQRMERLEKTVAEHGEKIDFFIRTSLPPVEGIFFNGQIFDAYKFVSDLIKSANSSIVLIDNYIDESVLMIMTKRSGGVLATIYTQKVSAQLNLDIKKHNTQYSPITIKIVKECHDRFLIIDGIVYHIGASIKDLGKKLFAFSKLNLKFEDIIKEGYD